jgi:hypothetical protein
VEDIIFLQGVILVETALEAAVETEQQRALGAFL